MSHTNRPSHTAQRAFDCISALRLGVPAHDTHTLKHCRRDTTRTSSFCRTALGWHLFFRTKKINFQQLTIYEEIPGASTQPLLSPSAVCHFASVAFCRHHPCHPSPSFFHHPCWHCPTCRHRTNPLQPKKPPPPPPPISPPLLHVVRSPKPNVPPNSSQMTLVSQKTLSKSWQQNPLQIHRPLRARC